MSILAGKWFLVFWLTDVITPFPDVYVFDTQADCYTAQNVALRNPGNRAVCAEIKSIAEIEH